ncbi:MAG TPA: SGNH/GDSL hydrolase family protein [Solirubrobacter sp.]
MSRGARLRFIAVAALLAGCGGSAPNAPEVTQTPSGGAQLVVVGDSLAAGRFADTQAQAFPQLVAADTHARLAVLGMPGATTAQLAADALPSRGADIVVEAGTNDFIFQTPRSRFANDYRALLAKVTAASPGAKLVCVTTWVPETVANQPAAKIPVSFYDTTIRRACTGGAVADVSPIAGAAATRGPAGRSTFLGPGDDFHPNSAGHAAIARLIESKLG